MGRLKYAVALIALCSANPTLGQERPTDTSTLKALYDGYLFGMWCQARGESFNDVNLGVIKSAGERITARLPDPESRNGIYSLALNHLVINTDQATALGVERECRLAAGKVLRLVREIDDLTYPVKPPF